MAENALTKFLRDVRFGGMKAKASQQIQARGVAEAVIANGQAASAALDLGEATALAVQMPAAWTAAGLYVQASDDGVTFGPVSDKSGTPYAIAVAASEVVALDREILRPFRHIKLVSGAAGADVNQAAARTLKVILG